MKKTAHQIGTVGRDASYKLGAQNVALGALPYLVLVPGALPVYRVCIVSWYDAPRMENVRHPRPRGVSHWLEPAVSDVYSYVGILHVVLVGSQ